MERLTEKRFAEKGYYLKCSEMCEEMNCSFCEHDSDALDKLGEYEDAEEQGLLVRLPCKVGDTVWVIFTSYVCEELGDLPETRHYIESRPFKLSMLGNFSKTVFLTREEAEASLAKEG